MTLSTPRSRHADLRRPAPAGFTLIELILVLALLALAAGLAAPHLSTFFRGRTLDNEARRLLALTRYGQSRAVSEGVPVALWIDSAAGSYGLEIVPGFADADDRAVDYASDSGVVLSTETAAAPVPYEDTGTIAADATTAITFNPDGQIDPSSVSRILLRQDGEAALALVPNRLGTGYEIVPADLPQGG